MTHWRRGLAAVDEIVVLAAGRVLKRGSHTEMLARTGCYRDAWLRERAADDVYPDWLAALLR